MQCPKCGGRKQRVIESRHTEFHVWRRRVCVHCHHTFITQEVLAETRTMPPEVHRFKDANRKTPKKPPEKNAPPKFDTSGLSNFRW